MNNEQELEVKNSIKMKNTSGNNKLYNLQVCKLQNTIHK